MKPGIASKMLSIPISARTGEGIEALGKKFAEMLAERVDRRCYRIPQERGDLVALLHQQAKVLETGYVGNEVVIEALVGDALDGRLRGFSA